MSQFKQLVFNVVASIPAGKVMTYSQTAKAIGRPKAVRAVGNALHKNTNPKLVPCHRVVSSTGKVSLNYKFGGVKAQKEKLGKEGISFKDDHTIKNLSEYFFIK